MDVESEMKTEELLGDELCRLCANTDKQMIPIFQGEGIEHNIPEQIETYLPIITVTQTDELPLNICYQCTSTLIAWHNFFEQCRSADNRLREILSVNIKFNEDDETYHDYTDDFHNDLDDQALVTDDAQVDCVLIEPKVSHVPISACSNESILPISDEQILPVSDRQISPVNDRQISPVSDKPIPTVSDAQISTLDAPIMETSDNDSVSKDESKSVIETVNDSRAARAPQIRVRKRYRCVLCATMTGTKTEMGAHMSEAHSFVKLESQEEAAPAKKPAAPPKKPAPPSDGSSAAKQPAKRKPAPADGGAPAKKRAPDNSAAGDTLMRSWVRSEACADIAPAWQCLACRQQFDDTAQLQEHVLSAHVESETNAAGPLKLRILGYCCPVCGRGFDELEYMIGHQLATHDEQPTFENVKRSADWALLCFTCLQYYRRADKWFTGHRCHNWADAEALQRTQSEVAAPPRFVCDVCAATFRYKCAYQYHRQARHKGVTELRWEELAPTTVPFVCDKCDKGYARAEDFRGHVCDTTPPEEVAPVPPDKPKVPCPQCNAMLANAKIMRRHVKTVHEKQSVRPPRADIDYRKYRSEVPTIRCPFCDELRFRTSKDMLAHAKHVHNQELANPYFCAKCVRQFKSNAKLRRHYEVHHSGPEDKETVMAVCRQAERTRDQTVFYMCPSCARKFLDPMEYFRHHQWHQMKREFTCDRCGYSAPTKESLNLHMRSVHLDNPVRKFACNQCDSVLSSQFSLREHLAATHGTERPYVCERCGKDFPTKVRLQSHIRIHLFGSQLSMSQRRYGCDLCGKDFKKKQTLRDHLAVHSGVKSEACEVCGKLFFTKLSAYCHRIQTHSTVRPYKCTTCEATFPLRSFLTRHMKKHAEREARKALNAMGGNSWLSTAEKKAAQKIKDLVAEESNSDTEQSYYEEYESKSFISEEL